jgi:hypothetical protein
MNNAGGKESTLIDFSVLLSQVEIVEEGGICDHEWHDSKRLGCGEN